MFRSQAVTDSDTGAVRVRDWTVPVSESDASVRHGPCQYPIRVIHPAVGRCRGPLRRRAAAGRLPRRRDAPCAERGTVAAGGAGWGAGGGAAGGAASAEGRARGGRWGQRPRRPPSRPQKGKRLHGAPESARTGQAETGCGLLS